MRRRTFTSFRPTVSAIWEYVAVLFKGNDFAGTYVSIETLEKIEGLITDVVVVYCVQGKRVVMLYQVSSYREKRKKETLHPKPST